MEKSELNATLDQMKSLCTVGDYEAAADVADTVNWSRARNANALVKVGEIYEKAGRLAKCKELFLMAYEKAPIGRNIIFRLAEIAIRMEDYDLAKEYYDEFLEIAPNDNLRFALEYRIREKQGAPYKELISILEELLKDEYTEEWAFELAKLYHLAGYKDKCVSTCDELILWFGDGPYVQKALELKILYHPLTKEQEQKYRSYRLGKAGKLDVRMGGQDVDDLIRIPVVEAQSEKFNTSNLQKEIALGIQRILDARKLETVNDTLDSLKKITKDLPYLQALDGDSGRWNTGTSEILISGTSPIVNDMLSEDSDGQISMITAEEAQEKQITGQMTLQDIMDDWEKKKKATEVVLKQNEERILEDSKAKALQEAEGIMERLNGVKPKLDAGYTTKDIMDEMYLGEDAVSVPKIGSAEQEEDPDESDTIIWNLSMQRTIEADDRETRRIDPNDVETLARSFENQQGEEPLESLVEPLMPEVIEEIETIGGADEVQEEEILEMPEIVEETMLVDEEEILEEPEIIGEPDEMEELEPVEEAEELEPVEEAEELEAVEEAEELEAVEEAEELEAVEEAEELEAVEEAEELEAVEEAEELEAVAAENLEDAVVHEEIETIGGSDEIHEEELPEESEVAENLDQVEEEEMLEEPDLIGTYEEFEESEELEEPLEIEAEELEELEETRKIEVSEETEEPEELEEIEEPAETEEAEETEELEEPEEPIEVEDVEENEDFTDISDDAEVEEEYDNNEYASDDNLTEEYDAYEEAEESADEYNDKLDDTHIEEDIDVEANKPAQIKRLTNEMRSAFSYFVPIKGMEPQLCKAINVISERLTGEEKSEGGNLIIQGDPGCGKTVLAASFIRVLQDYCGCPEGKVGHIDGEALNKKNIQQLFRRVEGGCLIVENAGKIERNTAVSLAYLMDNDDTGILMILEDDEAGIKKVLEIDEEFAKHFDCVVNVPIFTNDELVAFARAYAREIGYKIDDVAILALHNRISNIQRQDQATTLAEVKDIVDEAIERESHFNFSKYMSLVTGKRYTKDDRILLTERHFS